MFQFLVLCMAGYELSKLIYPDLEYQGRKESLILKQTPQVEVSTAKDGTTAVCPGQVITVKGVPVAKVPLSPEFKAYTYISLIYTIMLIVSAFGGLVYTVGCIGVLVLSSIVSKFEPSKTVVRLDALATLSLLFEVIRFG